MDATQVREMTPDGITGMLSDDALAMFSIDTAKSAEEMDSQTRDYQRLSISALTMCCTCD